MHCTIPGEGGIAESFKEDSALIVAAVVNCNYVPARVSHTFNNTFPFKISMLEIICGKKTFLIGFPGVLFGRDPPHVSHRVGMAMVIGHVESHVCGTVLMKDMVDSIESEK